MTNDSRCILCVDDDADMLTALRLFLAKDGYRVVTADGVDTGVAAYREHAPALVFVDLMMESIDSGIDFLNAIRALGPTPPVYLLSTVGGDFRQNVDAAAMGFTGTLQKPVAPDQLLALVRAKMPAAT